jgi:F0F1-type ATP synthase epsilon subunit
VENIPDIAFIVGGLVVIVAVIGFVSVKEERIKAQAKGAVEGQERINADTAAEIARLRDRLEVVERLVTDDDRKLSREIAQLRNGQTVANS